MGPATIDGQVFSGNCLHNTSTSQLRLGEKASPPLTGIPSADGETLHSTSSSPVSHDLKPSVNLTASGTSRTGPYPGNEQPASDGDCQNDGGNASKSFAKRVWSSVNEKYVTREPLDGRAWRTTLVRFGPLSGIFCMALALASIIASLGILIGSNGQSINKWSAPPSTYLAILTAIANLSIRYACIQGRSQSRVLAYVVANVVAGVVVAWWWRASRGSTLAKLHNDWRAGTTIRGAIVSGRHMGLCT
jgi:hypothetical protein